MRVWVDENKCDIIGICVKELPEVFRFHEGSKKAYARQNEVPPALEQRVLEVAGMCPNQAIMVKP